MTYPRLEELPAEQAPRKRSRFALAGFVAVSAIALAGIVYAFAGTAGTLDSQRRDSGKDSRSPLGAGLSAVVQTEARAVVQVRIRTVEEDFSMFTATVAGLTEGEIGDWYAILDDGREVPVDASLGDDGLVTVSLDGAAPTGRTVEEVRLSPDDTPGDIYFDLRD